MEILQFLISFLLEEYKDSTFAPILKQVKEHGFNLKSILSNLTPDMVAPIIRTFMQGLNKNSPTEPVGQYGVKPIINFADKDIVNTLNCYFG